jgi:hypothetical protein
MKAALLLVPIAAASEASWQWVDIPGTKCIKGQETGIWTRKGSGKNLGVYLYPGGACFNLETCTIASSTNPKPGNPGSKGIFDSRSDNPLVEYNWVAVPYCTGDVHAGEDAKRFAEGFRNFNGAPNLKLMMQYATEQFTGVETLFITGESAGGFGSAASYCTIRDFYPDARGVLMDDSGPILDDDAMPVCLQEKFRTTWNLNKNIPKDCPCYNDEGNLASLWTYGPQRYPKDSFSLVSSQNDLVISTFYGYSKKNCTALLPVGYNKLHEGLQRLSKVAPVYTIPGSAHTHTSHNEFYTRSVNSVPLFKWIEQLLDPTQPDPESVEPTVEDILAELDLGFNAEGSAVV